MNPPQTRGLSRLQARYQELAAHFTGVGYILKGSVVQRFMPCSSPGCRCHANPPQLHGPYWQWSTRVAGKTVSRRLTQQQARQYQQWIDNRKSLEKLLEQMYDISAQAATILLDLQHPQTDNNHPPKSPKDPAGSTPRG